LASSIVFGVIAGEVTPPASGLMASGLMAIGLMATVAPGAAPPTIAGDVEIFGILFLPFIQVKN